MIRDAISLVRIAALLAALAGIAMAATTKIDTVHFLANARVGEGRVLSPDAGNGSVTVGVDIAGQHHEIRLPEVNLTDARLGSTVPVLYSTNANGKTDIRIGPARRLEKRMWSWVEFALGAMFVSVYGRAMVENPLSVIGFKSWRSTRR